MDEENNRDVYAELEKLEKLSIRELAEKFIDPKTTEDEKSEIFAVVECKMLDEEDISAMIPVFKKTLISNPEFEQSDEIIFIICPYYAKEKKWGEISGLLKLENDKIRKGIIGWLNYFLEREGDISPIIPELEDRSDFYTAELVCKHYLEKEEFEKVTKYYRKKADERAIGALEAIHYAAKKGKDVSYFFDDMRGLLALSYISPVDDRITQGAVTVLTHIHISRKNWDMVKICFMSERINSKKGAITALRGWPGVIENSTIYKLMEEALYDKNEDVRKYASRAFVYDIVNETLPVFLKEEPKFMDKVDEKNKLKIKVRSLLIDQDRLERIYEIKEDIAPLLIEFMTDSAPEVATNATDILLERLKKSVIGKINKKDYFSALEEIKDFSKMVNKQKDKLHPRLRRGIITYLNDLSLVVQNKMNKLDDKEPVTWNTPKKDGKDSSSKRKTPVRQR